LTTIFDFENIKSNVVDSVRKEYEDLCRSLISHSNGCGNSVNIYKYWISLINNYIDRPYHNFNHISSGLVEINKRCLTDECIVYKNELKFAWINHDFITGCRQAELMTNVFVCKMIHDIGLASSLKEEIVYDLIMETSPECYLTEGPSKTGMYEADLIHDIDFICLGLEWKEFCDYGNKIIKEYGKRFNPRARVKFLKTVQNMQHIYRTIKYYDSYEEQARNNIEKMLKEIYIL